MLEWVGDEQVAGAVHGQPGGEVAGGGGTRAAPSRDRAKYGGDGARRIEPNRELQPAAAPVVLGPVGLSNRRKRHRPVIQALANRLLGAELSRLQEIRRRIDQSTDRTEAQALIGEADDLLSRAEHDAAADLLDAPAIASLRSAPCATSFKSSGS